MYNHFASKYSFEIFAEKYNNIDRIHPLKQKEVGEIVAAADNDSNVKLVVVFGSSADFRCNSNSDIDVYIERFEDKPLKKAIVASEVDYIFDLDHESKLFKEIEKTGIVVFEREEKSCAI